MKKLVDKFTSMPLVPHSSPSRQGRTHMEVRVCMCTLSIFFFKFITNLYKKNLPRIVDKFAPIPLVPHPSYSAAGPTPVSSPCTTVIALSALQGETETTMMLPLVIN